MHLRAKHSLRAIDQFYHLKFKLWTKLEEEEEEQTIVYHINSS